MRGRRPQPILPLSSRPGKQFRSSSVTIVRAGLLLLGLLVFGFTVAAVFRSKPKAPKPAEELKRQYEDETGLKLHTEQLDASQDPVITHDQSVVVTADIAAQAETKDEVKHSQPDSTTLTTDLGHSVTPSTQADVSLEPSPAAVVHKTSGLYAMSAKDIFGDDVQLSKYAGKVTLVVNVASACGYTDENYKGLEKLYQDYQAAGLAILGFPCNQFGSQESGTEAEIHEFCNSKYHVTFDMFSKVDVNGPDVHPVYKFLKRELPLEQHGGGGHAPGQELQWNFNKFLVDRQGRPVRFFYSQFEREPLEAAIKELLAQPMAEGNLLTT